MRLSPSAVTALIGAAAAAAFGLPGAAAGASSPPARFVVVRACAYEAFSRSEGRCTRDQRTARLLSTRVSCSADFVVSRPARLLARMSYDGETVYEYRTGLLATGSQRWWIADDLRATPVPGGTWTCEFSVESVRDQVSFESGGPVGRIVGAAACTGANTVAFGGSLRICRGDESGLPHRAIDEIVCSGVFTKSTSDMVEVHLLRDSRAVATASPTTIGGPIWLVVGAFEAPTPRGRFPVGDYACRFTVDGETVAEVPYQVTAA
jgi:hypothetical protein